MFPPAPEPILTPAPHDPPALHHDPVVAEGSNPRHWLLFLHGIFGSGRNWRGVARKLVRARPEWGALLVDLRQHGRSLHLPGPHTLAAAAADLRRLVTERRLGSVGVLGHSFGGKVALRYAADDLDRVETVWVVDSTPSARPPGGSAWDKLAALRAAPGPFPDREKGVQALLALGVSEAIARFMALNLEQEADGWRWRIDPDEMEALLRDFFATDLWPVVEAPPPGLDLHVVKAEASSLLGEADCRRVEAAGARTGRVRLHRVPGGHWVNADSPDELVALLVDGLP